MRLSTLLPVSSTFLSVVFTALLPEANINALRTGHPTTSDEFVGINITAEGAKVPQALSKFGWEVGKTWGPHPEPWLMYNSMIIWYSVSPMKFASSSEYTRGTLCFNLPP
ncbi:hypothetical protein DFH08DRAFT_969310 [Mycena albidolilacea]|uniref:Uncharacterized protein n=1 Tax=Mycena albidolilacea TaxID=1033008 RepID=A0AAD6ZII7_9AGAR|nr:hypothetical protein DFH08DRAFT_969310 [Mycena albidolilacea]